MKGGGLSPGDGWNVALLFVEVALGCAAALLILVAAASVVIFVIRYALAAPLPTPATPAGTHGQVPAVGAVAPRLTPYDQLVDPDRPMPPMDTERSSV